MIMTKDNARAAEIVRPIIGIENRTAQEVFDMMCDRFRGFLRTDTQTKEGEGYTVDGKVYEAAVKGRQDFRSAYRELRELLTAEEWSAVEELADQQELSVKATLRQAVRFYQLHVHRLRDGEIVTWSGDAQRARDFAGPLARPSQGEGIAETVEFTVSVLNDGSTTLRTRAKEGVNPFSSLDAAIAALCAERKDAELCPVHRDQGFDAAISAIRGWAAGMLNDRTRNRLNAVADDLESNRATILAALRKSQSKGDR